MKDPYEYTSVVRTRRVRLSPDGQPSLQPWDVSIEDELAHLVPAGWVLIEVVESIHVDGFGTREEWLFRRLSPSVPQRTMPAPATRPIR